MKTMKSFLPFFFILISYGISAQEKTISTKEKDSMGEIKISPIVQPTPVQPSKVIICGPSRSALIQILYILDGKKIDQKEFSKINPNDIESIKALKINEAKLLYGEQGEHGVIIITSKKK